MAARAVAGVDAPAVARRGLRDRALGRGVPVASRRRRAGSACDLPDSPEVRMRTRSDAEFHVFDGLNLPFEEASFDVVYCAQVLEHARHPESLLIDVARVLKPGGALAGSTSQLEPFHSRSTFNFTPHGLSLLLESAGPGGRRAAPERRRAHLDRAQGTGWPRALQPLVAPRVAAQPGDRRLRRACPPRSAVAQCDQASVQRPDRLSARRP